jgi:site-specific DNA-methyltransferase (adenine-specific)
MNAIIREERIGDCRLILGDCLEVMPSISAVDMVCTSPPYDNLRDYGPGFNGVDLFRAIELLAASLSCGGVCMWNVADATIDGSETGSSFKQALHAMSCGLNIHDTMIAIRDNVNFPESVRYFSGHEYMFIFSKGAPKTFNPIIDRVNKWAGTTMHGTDRLPDGTTRQISGKGKKVNPYGMRFNWWRVKNNAPQSNGHPAPMPYTMASDQITSWSSPSETILDPFMGSGTTLVACAKLGRKGVGIELDPDYFEIACKRVEEAYRQPDLFVAPPSEQPKQEGFDI